MNCFKHKAFGYPKYTSSLHTPRLHFCSKFTKSAFSDGNMLHPGLEDLLLSAYSSGSIDVAKPIQLSMEEEEVLWALIAKLKRGRWFRLEELIYSDVIAIAALHQYLKCLKNSLWSKVSENEWNSLSRCFGEKAREELSDEETVKQFVAEARNLLRSMKASIRRFSSKLLFCLHEVAARSGRKSAGALRLAEFFGPVLVGEKQYSQIPNLQGTIAVMIEESRAIIKP